MKKSKSKNLQQTDIISYVNKKKGNLYLSSLKQNLVQSLLAIVCKT